VIDHVSIRADDFARTCAFYDAVLPSLGYGRQVSAADHVGYGAPSRPLFWVLPAEPGQAVGRTGHLAFAAPNRAAVDAFHRAALAAGARDNGAPGPRHYHANYYAAFVIDPEGHRIEAVCHRPA
jgi:catechol 2,3-dioxygenase-like lactoylglutathione lyase family enzyme